MIQPNELRIGNKLTDQYDRVLSVYEIRPIGIRCLYKGQQNTEINGVRNGLFTFEDLHPIELSPEILEKIEGIEINTDEGCVWHELLLRNGITIIEGDKNGYCEMVIYIQGKELRCRYLHVLQNWVYFFSQGQQELTINL